ncbi:hypothetical protein KP509_11G008200 [Ceratopteris richardii]|uniref:Pentatricopeptide repeat-containing protein n=1 Tax=Ceratopteris richardii TaxID=49495 RepID=A0A8T2TV89_CERRI|nr:hypothetical protein KP509_11G008200 [Ceratopteris richardii]KAH7424428.1 hypothetical protein KP509_11G008200 [Ceratopteris richardii]KAH7424429.1 hypothetical protein KP509_11G008200 [Ceratopteris richardii]KAH7424430.1 hypothetical protein KP509_11G008200 [Ceratopteris richardii]
MLRELHQISIYGDALSIPSNPKWCPSPIESRSVVQTRRECCHNAVVIRSKRGDHDIRVKVSDVHPERRSKEKWFLAEEGSRVKISDIQFERRGNKRRALTDDGARRVIKEKQALASQLRKNQPGARVAKWIRRSPAQMARFLADGRLDYRFNKYVDKAIRTISQLASKRKDSYDFGVVLNPWVGSLSFKDMCIVLREQKHVALACEFFRWMKLQGSYVPSVIPYTIILRKCGEAGKFDLVESFYKEMLQEGCEPDEVVICTMICIFGKGGQIENMMKFYKMMQSQGLFPQTVVLNFMLSSLYKAGLYSDAIDLWKDLLAARIKPNEYTYGVIVNVFRKEGRSVEAFHIFEEMLHRGHLPDEILYNMVIKMLGDLGREDKIIELYERMKLQGLVLSKHTYTYLVHFFGKIGNYKLAVTFFSEMQHMKIPPDEVIYGTIITIYGNLGMYADAEQAFKEIDKAGLIASERIFIVLASVRMNAGQYDSALQLFDEMQSRGFGMTKYAWIIVLQCCLRQQKVFLAESAFDIMVNENFADAVAFTCMFNLYRKMQMVEAGNSLLSKLENSNVQPDKELYDAVITHLCNAGLIQQAEIYFSQMQMKGLSIDGAVKTMLMKAYGRVGRVADAESIYLSLESADAMSISVMFTIYEESGNNKAAYILSKRLLECGLKFYNKFLLKCASRGSMGTVGILCSQMLANGQMPAEETLLASINLFDRNEECRLALNLIEQGHNSGFYFSPTIYEAVLKTCIKYGQEREADVLLQSREKVGSLRITSAK